MLYKLRPEADFDLETIFEYSYQNFGEDQAVKYLQSFDELFNHLCQNALTGKSRNELIVDLRSINNKSQIVFYRVIGELIIILRVLHGSRDLPRYF